MDGSIPYMLYIFIISCIRRDSSETVDHRGDGLIFQLLHFDLKLIVAERLAEYLRQGFPPSS